MSTLTDKIAAARERLAGSMGSAEAEPGDNYHYNVNTAVCIGFDAGLRIGELKGRAETRPHSTNCGRPGRDIYRRKFRCARCEAERDLDAALANAAAEERGEGNRG